MFAVVILGYLIGSLPVAVIVGRLRGTDPRTAGDGNAGWWNMRGLVGKRMARIVLVGDVTKGAAAVTLALVLVESWWGPYVAAGAAMLGHSFPVFSGFRGGKSILTFAGAMAVICPGAVALALSAGATVGRLRRQFALGLQISFAVYPLMQSIFDPLTHVAATGVLMTFIGFRFLSARMFGPAKNYSDEPMQA